MVVNRWVIAASGCCINILISGTSRLAPLMFVACLDRFNADRGRTSFPFILCYLLRTLAGPLIGYLGAKFGLRSVTIIGCLMSALGVGACFFAEDILAITILFGVLFGLGYGFGISLVPAILCLHFKKNLTVANGLFYVGTSIGASILPSVFDAILHTYGVSGSFLILGAIVLNSIPCAMLLVLPDSRKQTISGREDDTITCQKSNSISKHEQHKKNSSSQLSTIPINSYTESSHNIYSNSDGYINKGFETILEDTTSTNTKTNESVKAIRRPSSVFNVTSGTPVLLQYSNSDTQSTNTKNMASVKAIRQPSLVLEVTSGTPLLIQYNSNKISSILYTEESIINPSCESQNPDGSGLRSFHIFCDPAFLVIAFIQSAYTFYCSVVFTVLVDYLRDKGIEKSKEIYFLVCFALSDTFGRLLMGFVVDGGFMSNTNFCSACFILLFLTCCLMSWSYSFGLMLFATMSNAFFIGATTITFPGMIFNFMNSEDRTMAMACRLTIYAPMGLVVSPAINFFRETLGSYDWIFYILGALNALCCLMTYFIPHIVRRREQKKLNATISKLNQNGVNTIQMSTFI